MRFLIVTLLLVSSLGQVIAARQPLHPREFEPLTSLPWTEPDATLQTVLERIFREPNPVIRYPVLAEYLRTIPVAQLGKAFDLCIELEGTQTPDSLIELILPIWAERDPLPCWERTKQLMELVGIEEGWLTFDSWGNDPPITVRNLRAIRSSSFWIEDRAVLHQFPIGAGRSKLSSKRRHSLLKEFTARWLEAFGEWPAGSGRNPYPSHIYGLAKLFDAGSAASEHSVFSAQDFPSVEIAARRWLHLEPGSAPKILATLQEKKLARSDERTGRNEEIPSTEVLMIWAKVDLPAMKEWAESLDTHKDDLGIRIRAFLMSRVDPDTRERWLREAKSDDPERDQTDFLMESWSGFDPEPVLERAAAMNSPQLFSTAYNAAVYGYGRDSWNFSRHALGVIREFEVTRLSTESWDSVIGEITAIMEQWGSVDVGDCARYGLNFILKTDYAQREPLLEFFRGKDNQYAGEDNVIDRTFCALRVWAVVKPQEMKAWIATLDDPELQKALTWLLENPWGGETKSKGGGGGKRSR